MDEITKRFESLEIRLAQMGGGGRQGDGVPPPPQGYRRPQAGFAPQFGSQFAPQFAATGPSSGPPPENDAYTYWKGRCKFCLNSDPTLGNHWRNECPVLKKIIIDSLIYLNNYNCIYINRKKDNKPML